MTEQQTAASDTISLGREPKVIKRYANRKLYDTRRSRYVTLEQISEMIRACEDVKIVDNNSKDDLTSVTLAQIILEEEKRKKSFLPLAAMRDIIQSGGESIQEWFSKAGDRVTSVFRRAPSSGGDGEEPPPEPAAASLEPSASPPKERADGGRALREFLDASQRTFEEWQKRIDERVRLGLESISPFAGLQKEIGSLSARITDLERRVSDLAPDQSDPPAGG